MSSIPLKHIHTRTRREDFEGNKRFAKYSLFYINDSSIDYQIGIDGYSGDAGDSMIEHNGMKFSTKDQDNDVAGGNCAVSFKVVNVLIHKQSTNNLY